MTKRVIVATLAKEIGALEVEGTAYPLISPNGYVVQKIEAAGDDMTILNAYEVVGMCAPSMPREVLLQIGTDDIGRIIEEIRQTILGLTREVLPEGPKAEAAASS